MSDLIQQPHVGDAQMAEDALDEIQAVLAKRGLILVTKPNWDCMVLAVIDKRNPLKFEARAIAQIREISPRGYDWRPIEWDERNGSKLQ